jgi:hydroxyacylglutathione hydrolase
MTINDRGRPEVVAIPAFEDNYIWLVHNGENCIVVDPGDAEAVINALDKQNLRLSGILITHHHGDHTGGIPHLVDLFDCPVIGPKEENIPGLTQRVDSSDSITPGALGIKFAVLDVPGHTKGHVAYYCPELQWLFAGDTLFAAGCGRLFEGTHEQMYQSLSKLAALPDTTQVFCAHEYTLSNLSFALEVDPLNPALIERAHIEKAKREQGLPTIPTSIAIEKLTNPFLRTSDQNIAKRLGTCRQIIDDEPVAVFSGLRRWKDEFR